MNMYRNAHGARQCNYWEEFLESPTWRKPTGRQRPRLRHHNPRISAVATRRGPIFALGLLREQKPGTQGEKPQIWKQDQDSPACSLASRVSAVLGILEPKPPCLHLWYCSTDPGGCPSAHCSALPAAGKRGHVFVEHVSNKIPLMYLEYYFTLHFGNKDNKKGGCITN